MNVCRVTQAHAGGALHKAERKFFMKHEEIEKFRERAKKLRDELSKHNSYYAMKSGYYGISSGKGVDLHTLLLQVTAFLYDTNSLLNHLCKMEQERVELIYALCSPCGEKDE